MSHTTSRTEGPEGLDKICIACYNTNMQYIHIQHISVALLFVVAGVLYPLVQVQAAYEWNGQTFETREERNAYIAEYIRVWRELHAKDAATTKVERTVDERLDSRRTESRVLSSSQNGYVRTDFARDIDHDSARLQSDVDLGRAHYFDMWFYYGTNPNSLDRYTPIVRVSAPYGEEKFDMKIYGLRAEQTYYYRAAARNPAGTVAYGSLRNFTTEPDFDSDDAEIRVRTNRPTKIDERFTEVEMRIDFNESPFARVWFEYGRTQEDMDRTTRVVRVWSSDEDEYTYTLRNLRPSSIYYVRAVGQDHMGLKHYGKPVKFTTKRDIENEKPSLKLVRPEDITTQAATLVAEVDMNDFKDGILFFVYGESREDVADVAEERYYVDIRERGDDLQRVLVDPDFDGFDTVEKRIAEFDEYTRYYYSVGVQYENEDGRETILLSQPRSLLTKRR